MENDYGKQMGIAIHAVLDMQSDCIRLFHDLDNAFRDYQPLLGGPVTTGIGRLYQLESTLPCPIPF